MQSLSPHFRRSERVGESANIRPPRLPVAGVADDVVARPAERDEARRRCELRPAGMNGHDVMHFEVFGRPAGLAKRLAANVGVPPCLPAARSGSAVEVRSSFS
jgi:hypothetical protein